MCTYQHCTLCTRRMTSKTQMHMTGIEMRAQQQLVRKCCIPIQDHHSYIRSDTMSMCTPILFRNSIALLSDTIQLLQPLCTLHMSSMQSMYHCSTRWCHNTTTLRQIGRLCPQQGSLLRHRFLSSIGRCTNRSSSELCIPSNYNTWYKDQSSDMH